MPAKQPTGDQFRALRDDPFTEPVAMVNIVKCKPLASYESGAAELTDDPSGRAAYARYMAIFEEMMQDVGGTCLFLGAAERMFIGEGEWDFVWINHFPNRQAFIATLNHAKYQEGARHRLAGLEHQDLIVTHPSDKTS